MTINLPSLSGIVDKFLLGFFGGFGFFFATWVLSKIPLPHV
jgi:hypothetical protein